MQNNAFFDSCVNSDDIHYEAFQDAILRLEPSFNEGKPISREFYDENMSGRLNPVIVATLFPHLSQDEQTSLWQAKEAQYEDKIRLGVPPIDGLVDLIKRCQRHDIIQYIVTNAPKGSARTTLTSIKLAPFFGGNVVFGEECEHPKPHPEPYLHTLKLAGVEADSAIAFEDSVSGTTSATRAGIYTIGLRSTQPDTVLRAAGAAFTIADYTDPALQEFLAPNLGK